MSKVSSCFLGQKNKSLTRILCEAGIMIALAQVLSYFKLEFVANGGAIDLTMIPIIVFAASNGVLWGAGAGLILGALQYFLGGGTAIDWVTMVCDYLVAFTLVGVGAGLGRLFPKKAQLVCGTILACVLRFLAHLIVGVYVWGVYMPDEFMGMAMNNTWIYSTLYNGSYMLPNLIIALIVIIALKSTLLNRMMNEESISVEAVDANSANLNDDNK